MIAPFIPERLPVKGIRRARFNNALKQALEALKRIEPSSLPLKYLLALETINALEPQGLHLSVAAFYRLQKKKGRKTKEERQLLHYYAALKSGMRAIRTQDITKELLCTLHERIKRGHKKASAGKYRTQQNWIGSAHCTQEEADFFPPTVPVMQRAMRNCLSYCNRTTKEPLVQIAITIAQLLIIHPFMDGNGRIARILAALLIYKKGLLSEPVLFLSPYFQAHRKAYIRKLYEITEKGKWEEWIVFFLKGVKEKALKDSRLSS